MTHPHQKKTGPRGVRALALLMTLGTVGTATAAPEPAQSLTLLTPRNAITARVTRKDITSADIQLTHDGSQLRGRMFGRVVFLELGKDEVAGTVGSQHTRLTLQEREGLVEARGNFLGTLLNLRMGPQTLTASVGPCGYELKAMSEGTAEEGTKYQGTRSCGGIPQRPVFLTLPPRLTEQGPAMTLTTVALLLTGA